MKMSLNPSDGLVGSLEPSHIKYRSDIDGLRAIAVLSVVGFHAFPNWIRGGFAGVDIFFVISGFLISSIICTGLDSGHFSFTDFYARRIRRIFPALILIFLACYLFGWVALLAEEYKQLGKHIAGGAGFISNFLLWNESGYFDNAAATKPLLHLWSLGIEEQFYVIWPLMLYIAYKQRLNAIYILLLIVIISFGLNIVTVGSNATATFFSPITRFWELAIGSVLAYATISNNKLLLEKKIPQVQHSTISSFFFFQQHRPCSRNLQNVKSIVGFVLIATAIFMLNQEIAFPGWLALLPTVGACFVISAGSSAWLNRIVLSSRVLVWFGLISFPLYLWHWPILSFMRIIESAEPPREIRVAVVLSSIILAWLTYKLIERPIRFGAYERAKVAVLFLLMTIIGLLGYNSYIRDGLGFRLAGFERNLNLINDVKETNEGCKSSIPVESRYCLIADASIPPTVALIGDSHSNRLFSPLAVRYSAKGENLLQLGEGGCLPFWDIETGSVGNPSNCTERFKPQLDYVLSSKHIKTVILAYKGAEYVEGTDIAGQHKYFIRDIGNTDLTDGKAIYEEALKRTLKNFLAAGKNVITIIDAPELPYDPKGCVDLKRPFSLPFSEKPSCKQSWESVSHRTQHYMESTISVSRSLGTIKIVNLQDALCRDGFCSALQNSILLYRDADHLNPYGAEFAINQLWGQF